MSARGDGVPDTDALESEFEVSAPVAVRFDVHGGHDTAGKKWEVSNGEVAAHRADGNGTADDARDDLGELGFVPLGGGLLLTSLGAALLTQLGLDSSYAAGALPSLLLVGFGLGAVFATVFNAATWYVDTGDAGVAGAAINASDQVGGSLGVALLNTITASTTADYLATHASGPRATLTAQAYGYSTGSAWAAGVLGVTAVIVFILVNTRSLTSSHDQPT